MRMWELGLETASEISSVEGGEQGDEEARGGVLAWTVLRLRCCHLASRSNIFTQETDCLGKWMLRKLSYIIVQIE